MNREDFNEAVDAFKTSSDEQRGTLAAIYGDIIESIAPAVVKAKYAAETLSPTVKGVTELKQLLQIMEGGFSTVATQIIQEATAASTPAEITPEAPEA